MNGGHHSAPTSTSSTSFVTPNKEQHANSEELLSRWSPDSESFLEMEEECPSRIRRTSSSGHSSSPSFSNYGKRSNGRNTSRSPSFQGTSDSFRSKIFGSSRTSLTKKKTGSTARAKAGIFFTIIMLILYSERDPSSMVMTTTSLDYNDAGAIKPTSVTQPPMKAAVSNKPKVSNKPIYPKPTLCTTEQLLKIRKQIPPETCARQHVRRIPFAQVCSLTAATKCPSATWLESFYLEQQQEHSKALAASNPQSPPSFLGISIGCNKGFDAINTLRMGTYDSSINKMKWKQAMTDGGSIELGEAVCSQDSASDMFPILESYSQATSNTPRPHGEMHCIEPMPQTYRKLQQSAESLGYTKKGLVVTHGAVSKESGEMGFWTGGKAAGVENVSLDACQGRFKQHCENVKVYSLKEYMETKVKASQEQNINVLSIDVEGYDADVLLGATSQILERVEYLEFEYNWMGTWKDQHLYDIVEMLDQQANMVCYWAGRDLLWRITECWMSYYDVHSWSNVACANRELVPELAAKMEATFQRTLKDGTIWVKSPQVKRRINSWGSQYRDSNVLSLEEKKLRQKYIS